MVAVLAGYDKQVSTAENDDARHLVTMTIRATAPLAASTVRDESEQAAQGDEDGTANSDGTTTVQSRTTRYPDTIRNVTYSYTFESCGRWDFAALNNCNLTGTKDLFTATCNDGAYTNTFYWYPPLTTTPLLRSCTMTTSAHVTFETGLTNTYSWPHNVGFVHAVALNNPMFNRNALICNTTDVPILFISGEGTYEIHTPSTYFTSAPIRPAQYSVVPNGSSSVVITVHPAVDTTNTGVTTTASSYATRLSQTIAITTTLGCSTYIVPGFHNVPWRYTFTPLESQVAQLSGSFRPEHGFWLYTGGYRMNSVNEFVVRWHPNALDGSTDILADQPLRADVEVLSSIHKEVLLQLSPEIPNQVVLRVSHTSRYRSICYQTQEYNATTGLVVTIIREAPTRIYAAPNDAAKLLIQFDQDIDMFDFTTWHKTPYVDPITGEAGVTPGVGMEVQLSPFLWNVNVFYFSRCISSLANCQQLGKLPAMDIQHALSARFELTLTDASYGTSKVFISRQMSQSDTLLIVFPIPIVLKSRGLLSAAGAGYDVAVVENVQRLLNDEDDVFTQPTAFITANTIKNYAIDHLSADYPTLNISCVYIVAKAHMPALTELTFSTWVDLAQSNHTWVTSNIALQSYLDRYQERAGYSSFHKLEPYVHTPHGAVRKPITTFAFPNGFSITTSCTQSAPGAGCCSALGWAGICCLVKACCCQVYPWQQISSGCIKMRH